MKQEFTKQQLLKNMDICFRRDRERFFAIADSLSFQPQYDIYREEIERLKQQWRDVPQQPGYPNIDHPLPLPEWFPKVHFYSRWEKDTYIASKLSEIK